MEWINNISSQHFKGVEIACTDCTVYSVVLYITKAQSGGVQGSAVHWLAATLSIGQLCCESARGSVTDSDENVKC